MTAETRSYRAIPPAWRAVTRLGDLLIVAALVCGTLAILANLAASVVFPEQAQADGRVRLHGPADGADWPALAAQVAGVLARSELATDQAVDVYVVPRWVMTLASPVSGLMGATGVTPYKGRAFVVDEQAVRDAGSAESLAAIVAHEVTHSDLVARFGVLQAGAPALMLARLTGREPWQIEGLCHHAAHGGEGDVAGQWGLLSRAVQGESMGPDEAYTVFRLLVAHALREGRSPRDVLVMTREDLGLLLGRILARTAPIAQADLP